MIDESAQKRIQRLHAFYLSQPPFAQGASYVRVGRQHLHYMRGYINICLNASTRPATDPTTYHKRVAYTTRLRRAYAEANILNHMEPVINEDELIVGRPDYSPLTPEEQKEYDELTLAMKGAPDTTLMTLGHMALDYPKLLKVGVNGLLDEIREKRSLLDLNSSEGLEKEEFYEGCEIELESVLVLQRRYAKKAFELMSVAVGQRRKELERMYQALLRVPAEPASTFYEALQAIHFYNFTLWELYYFGRVDQYLYPFYQQDLAHGRITYDEAVELFACFLLMPEGYILPNTAVDSFIGGRDSQRRAVENEITWIALDAAELARAANGKIAMGICSDTSEKLLRRAIQVNASGATQPALYNADVITAGMIQNGIAVSDAHNFANTGCTEMTPIGKSGMYPCAPYHNVARILLDAMRDEQDAASMEAILERFYLRLRQEVFDANLIINRRQMERSRVGGEPLRVSCLVDDCLVRGKAVDEGGAVYNHCQPTFVGIANVIDSLRVIETLVFEEKRLTLAEFISVLERNFVGQEALRQHILNRIPHYGVNDSKTDAFAVRVTDLIVSCCQGIHTYRNSILVPGTFTYVENVTHGRETPATPDGRLAGTPLGAGSSANAGMERKGPTAAILSATCWDQRPFMGGCVINMKFAPEQMSGANEEHILSIIRAFMLRHGMEIQFNCVSTETLLTAQKNPEQYRDLLVRVSGFSAHFTKLPHDIQQEVIQRNEHVFNT